MATTSPFEPQQWKQTSEIRESKPYAAGSGRYSTVGFRRLFVQPTGLLAATERAAMHICTLFLKK